VPLEDPDHPEGNVAEKLATEKGLYPLKLVVPGLYGKALIEI
jgi:hypothetical protein